MAPGRNKMQLIQLCWESFNLNFLVQHDAPLYKQITMLRHAMIGLYQILQCCQEIDNLEIINRQRSLLRTPYNWHNIISEQSWVFHLQVISTRKKRQFMGLVKRVGTTPLHFKFVIDCFEAMAHQATYCNLDCTNFMDIHMIGFVDDSNGQVKNSFL